MIETNRDAKQWGMFVHLAGLAGSVVPMGNILGPLVIWLMKREEMRFVDHQGKEALNFQLNAMLYLFVSALLTIVLIGFLLLPVIGIATLILTIVAGVEASKGNYYRYPCVLIKFIK